MCTLKSRSDDSHNWIPVIHSGGLNGVLGLLALTWPSLAAVAFGE